jgi:hypothetical protein
MVSPSWFAVGIGFLGMVLGITGNATGASAGLVLQGRSPQPNVTRHASGHKQQGPERDEKGNH